MQRRFLHQYPIPLSLSIWSCLWYHLRQAPRLAIPSVGKCPCQYNKERTKEPQALLLLLFHPAFLALQSQVARQNVRSGCVVMSKVCGLKYTRSLSDFSHVLWSLKWFVKAPAVAMPTAAIVKVRWAGLDSIIEGSKLVSRREGPPTQCSVTLSGDGVVIAAPHAVIGGAFSIQ